MAKEHPDYVLFVAPNTDKTAQQIAQYIKIEYRLRTEWYCDIEGRMIEGYHVIVSEIKNIHEDLPGLCGYFFEVAPHVLYPLTDNDVTSICKGVPLRDVLPKLKECA